MYLPAISAAEVRKRYTVGPHRAVFLDQIVSAGLIDYAYVMMVFKEGERAPFFVVASEVSSFDLESEGPSFFLCTFEGGTHSNFGLSHDWGDPIKFEEKALRMIAEKVGEEPAVEEE